MLKNQRVVYDEGVKASFVKICDNIRHVQVAHIMDCSPDDAIELARRGKLKGTKTRS